MTIYSANQPCIFPKIYKFNRMHNSDFYVSMNNAQFTKFDWQSRVELLDKHGNEQRIIIPLSNKSFARINEVQLIAPRKTVNKILRTLQMLYGRSTYYKGIIEPLECIMSKLAYDGITLAEFNNAIQKHLMYDVLEMDTTWVDSEILVPNKPDTPTEWLVQMGLELGCNIYLGGESSNSTYVSSKVFKDNGITSIGQDFRMNSYQRWTGQWVNSATASILEPLFAGGKYLAMYLIRQQAYIHKKG